MLISSVALLDIQGQLAALQRQAGAADIKLVDCANQLGHQLFYHSEFDKSLSIYGPVLHLRQAILGPDHPRVGNSLIAIANTYMRTGRMEQSANLVQRVLQIYRPQIDAQDVTAVYPLHCLAELFVRQGRYSEALGVLKSALHIQEKNSNRINMEYIDNLILTGLVHRNLNSPYIALRYYEQALNVIRKERPSDMAYSTVLINISNIHISMGAPAKATALIHDALATQEHGRDESTQDYYQILLYDLLTNTGDVDQAVRGLESIQARIERNPNRQASLPFVLQKLSNGYAQQGKLAQARNCTARSLMLLEREHKSLLKDISQETARLAHIDYRLQNYPSSLHYASRSTDTYLKYLAIQSDYLSEDDISEMTSSISSTLDYAFLALDKLRSARRDQGTGIALQHWLHILQAKNIAENLLVARSRRLAGRCQACLTELRYLRSAWAQRLLRGDVQEPGSDLLQQEREIAAAQPASLQPTVVPTPALLDSQRFRAICRQHLSDAYYLDYREINGQYIVIAVDSHCRINYRHIGSTVQVEESTKRLLALLTQRTSGLPAIDTELESLSTLLLGSLRQPLYSTHRIYVSLDGVLHSLPFQLLRDRSGAALVDRHDVAQVASLLDLERPAAPNSSLTTAIVADPEFTLALSQQPAAAGSPLGSSRGGQSLRPGYLPPLPGTRQEALAIKRLLPDASLYLGAAATEDRLLGLQAPSILHIATHGLLMETSDAASVSRAQRGHFVVDTAPHSGHPLLRSALALTGATTAPAQEFAAPNDASDGIVTALEISSMNLIGTQLVVLAACNSGRGVVQRGQGVYGLRRAFLTAGAESVVSTLWSVDDDVTSVLMRGFYARLIRGQSRAAALRSAQQEVRAQYPHPAYWAPFILLGKTGPIRGIMRH